MALIRRRRLGATLALLLLVPSACTSRTPEPSPGDIGGVGEVGEQFKIYYLQKQATEDYFAGEAEGAKRKAKELGLDLVMVDVGNDTGRTLDAVNTAVARQADGIIIVPPDPSVGPAVASAAKAGNVPLLASDEQICASKPNLTDCPAGQLVPRVGFSDTELGTEVGRKAAELYQQANWKPAETRIIAVWKRDLTTCADRVKAALPAFRAAGGPDIEVIEVGTDATQWDAQNKVAATVTANRSVKNWIVWGCDDVSVSGGVTAIENAGYSPDAIIGVGINGDLACEVWSAGRPTGVKATLWLNGGEVGALSVRSMYDKIRYGTDLKPETFAKATMVTPDTYRAAGLKCG